jgi:cell division protein FtsB
MAVARVAPDIRRSLPVRRLVMLVVLAVVAALYVAPVQKYLRVQRDLSHQRQALADAQRTHDSLVRQREALDTDTRIITLARECGWIFPGEKPLVIEGLPVGTASHCR